MKKKLFRLTHKKEYEFIRKYLKLTGSVPNGALLGRVMNYSRGKGFLMMNKYNKLFK